MLTKDITNFDLEFHSILAQGIINASQMLTTASLSKKELLSHPVIKSSLNCISSTKFEQFKFWFFSLSKGEYEELSVKAKTLKLTPDNLINKSAQNIFTPEETKSKGAIFTPSWLSSYITKKALRYWRQFNNGKGEPELAGDFSCGPGIFLYHLFNNLTEKTKIIGVDSCPEYVALARLHTISYDKRKSISIDCFDSLIDNYNLFSNVSNESSYILHDFDIVIGNPPYIRSQLLDPSYSKLLKQFYPEITNGNFDMTVLFILQTIQALKTGGVASIIVSSKFMSSKYGAFICKMLSEEVRILDIVDFGDGQVFTGKTTYTAILTFVKLPPADSFSLHQFPPGLKWDMEGSHLADARKIEIPADRLKSHPWTFTTGMHDKIFNLMQHADLPNLTDIFPKVLQGVRTGANNLFVIENSLLEEYGLEEELLLPFISGENIKAGRIIKPTHSLIWPYKYSSETKKTVLIPEELMKNKYIATWDYFQKHKNELIERNVDNTDKWYSFSRVQNLNLSRSRKILVKEMMPASQFAADIKGEFIFSSGYGLICTDSMPDLELKMWAAVLSTPTIEFQLRFLSTQLHSGWFRLLKQHLNRLKLPNFSINQRENAKELARKINNDPLNLLLWDNLDKVVAEAFNLTSDMRTKIIDYLTPIHAISCPVKKENVLDKEILSISTNIDQEETAYPELTDEQRSLYYPVELMQYNKTHRQRFDLGKLVTFTKNKKDTPIHRWYNYTQGYSDDLVKILLNEFNANSSSLVYDPFLGSGTTLLTCRSVGINSLGSDVSPLMTWLAQLKVTKWDTNKLLSMIELIENAEITDHESYGDLLFLKFLNKAFSPEILTQIVGWKNYINQLELDSVYKDFLFLGLISILEEISKIRKHGSHYRFLDNTDSVGLKKLNIKVINDFANIRPILLNKLHLMIDDVHKVNFPDPLAKSRIFNIDSRVSIPTHEKIDYVITSPPYLNRNNYLTQQKAELSILGLLKNEAQFKSIVESSLRSHVEGRFNKYPESVIPEVNDIIKKIVLTDNNNAKIPHMVAGYFDDLSATLLNLSKMMRKNGKMAFVVGNVRWGGVVIPVDHLLSLIAEKVGFTTEKTLVTRFKGNSPQQMKRHGKIPVRESIVILHY
ncbi:N-6 DNA methylase [Paenibacillus sp. FSL K6-1217]|uniref:Eco57I restriction-modification methylase domain-containing protein n=1 Tax=Paenibacillus sp. FSL K6-1217 TaxID=2921466 RepID=UPI0032470A3B